MTRAILIFTALIIFLLSVFKLGHYAYFSRSISNELVLAIIAVVFLVIGIYLNKKSLHKKPIPPKHINTQRIIQLGLSKRECEVLREISLGLSNKEIAEKLFVSESTIKTHVSNILVKLDAKRRTQAIKKAREFQIIPL
ncbi:response regulator transcription factor [Pareuzebyella sediminis]|uniref:response regulator transcription factor n=1 Tax=Pareuzebyella sediminis TaxID=2607998 RepID=UPI0011EEA4D5|nr:response regulator transcription factor [Pareuzebyella sediminis]